MEGRDCGRIVGIIAPFVEGLRKITKTPAQNCSVHVEVLIWNQRNKTEKAKYSTAMLKQPYAW
jgi:hypothetical protein